MGATSCRMSGGESGEDSGFGWCIGSSGWCPRSEEDILGFGANGGLFLRGASTSEEENSGVRFERLDPPVHGRPVGLDFRGGLLDVSSMSHLAVLLLTRLESECPEGLLDGPMGVLTVGEWRFARSVCLPLLTL